MIKTNDDDNDDNEKQTIETSSCRSFDEIFEEIFCGVIVVLLCVGATIIVVVSGFCIVILALLPLVYLINDVKPDKYFNIGIKVDIFLLSLLVVSTMYYIFLQAKKRYALKESGTTVKVEV